MAKQWLKKLGKGALAVSTGGTSLAFKKARPNYVAPARPQQTASKPIAQISARPTNPAQRGAIRPISARPTNPAQRGAIRPISARLTNPGQRGAMRPINPASARPTNPGQRGSIRPISARPTNPGQRGSIRPISARPTNPAQRGEIVGYNPETKKIIRRNQQGATPNISIVIHNNNNNNTPTDPIKKVVDKKTGKPLVAQRAK